jgi:hypothetical protein
MSSEGMGSMGNVPMNNQSSMPEMMKTYPPAAVKPAMENVMTYRAIYPEVYYKLKPYITMTCDLIFSYGAVSRHSNNWKRCLTAFTMTFAKCIRIWQTIWAKPARRMTLRETRQLSVVVSGVDSGRVSALADLGAEDSEEIL